MKRDSCVNDYAEILGLKAHHPLQMGKMNHPEDDFFAYGVEPMDWTAVDPLSFSSDRLQNLVKEMQWLATRDKRVKEQWLDDMIQEMETSVRNTTSLKLKGSRSQGS